jgi:hypothetical protein
MLTAFGLHKPIFDHYWHTEIISTRMPPPMLSLLPIALNCSSWLQLWLSMLDPALSGSFWLQYFQDANTLISIDRTFFQIKTKIIGETGNSLWRGSVDLTHCSIHLPLKPHYSPSLLSKVKIIPKKSTIDWKILKHERRPRLRVLQFKPEKKETLKAQHYYSVEPNWPKAP